MQISYEFEDFYYLRSGKRYKVDYRNCFGHRCSTNIEERPNSPSNSRNESGLIPPTPQKILVNSLVINQNPPRGQGRPSPQQPQPP